LPTDTSNASSSPKPLRFHARLTGEAPEVELVWSGNGYQGQTNSDTSHGLTYAVQRMFIRHHHLSWSGLRYCTGADKQFSPHRNLGYAGCCMRTSEKTPSRMFVSKGERKSGV
jgi:hypothetical protein